MSQSIKSVCALIIIVGVIVGVTTWMLDRPDTTMWALRIGCPLAVAASVGVIFKLNTRTALADDYLLSFAGTYFNCNGFCFALMAKAINGVAYLEAYFENQYDRPSIGKIAIRPARGFWMNRADIPTITYRMECGPAEFGVTRIPLPIPQALQGAAQTFEVGATVEYPDGKGRRLRFFDGVFLRPNDGFGDSFHTALTIVGAATGTIVLSRPASVRITLPTGVAQQVPPESSPIHETLWRLRDPPLVLAP
jgi:hypothetical protein